MGVKNNNIKIQPPSTNCGVVCEKILRALPDWFGIEESLVQYVKDADVMPTILAKDNDEVVGGASILPNDSGLSVRILSNSSEENKTTVYHISQMIRKQIL